MKIGTMPIVTKPPKICPECGAERGLVAKMLLDPPESESYLTAHYIVENCPDCKRAVRWIFDSIFKG